VHQIIPAILLGIGTPFLPHSPRWLASRGRDDESLRVLCKIRGLPPTDQRILREWFDIRSEDAYRKQLNAELHPTLQKDTMYCRIMRQIAGYGDCFRKGAWKRTHVGIGLMFFQRKFRPSQLLLLVFLKFSVANRFM
jgi:hypothetical protein